MPEQKHTAYEPPTLTHEGHYDVQTMSIGPIIIVKPELPNLQDFED